MNIVRLEPTAFLNSLPGYNLHAGVDEMLDLARELQTSDKYFYQGVPFPRSTDTTIAANQTANGTISIPPFSYLTSISYYDNQLAGVKVRLFDKGSRTDIIYGQYALDRVVASNLQLTYGVGTSPTEFGPMFLMSPLVIMPPGVLQWEIVSLAAIPSVVQFLLNFAVPVNAQSIAKQQIKAVNE